MLLLLTATFSFALNDLITSSFFYRAFASFSAQDGWDSLNRHLQSDSLSAELPGASDTSFDSIPVCATQVPVLGYRATHLNQTKLDA